MPETRKVSFIVNDREVRSVTGQRSEVLNENFWDVSGFVGQNARIEILDDLDIIWEHILIDSISYLMAEQTTYET